MGYTQLERMVLTMDKTHILSFLVGSAMTLGAVVLFGAAEPPSKDSNKKSPPISDGLMVYREAMQPEIDADADLAAGLNRAQMEILLRARARECVALAKADTVLATWFEEDSLNGGTLLSSAMKSYRSNLSPPNGIGLLADASSWMFMLRAWDRLGDGERRSMYRKAVEATTTAERDLIERFRLLVPLLKNGSKEMHLRNFDPAGTVHAADQDRAKKSVP